MKTTLTQKQKARLWDEQEAKRKSDESRHRREYEAAMKELDESIARMEAEDKRIQAEAAAKLERERLQNAPELLFEKLCEVMSDASVPVKLKGYTRFSRIIVGLVCDNEQPSSVDDVKYINGTEIKWDSFSWSQCRTLRRLIKKRIAYNALQKLTPPRGRKP